MQNITSVENTESNRMNQQAERLGFILRILPVIGLALLAIIILAVIAFAWMRVGLLIMLMVLVGLALIGGIYQAYAVRRDRRNFPPPGILSDAGGFKLHLLAMGEDTGKPIVILESGMASFAINWHWVQTELAQETRVVSYDRAGFGWSDVSPNPRDAQHCATELYTALKNAGIEGPYVLAGWSFGGLVIRAFTDLYADEVVGLTLVDSSHPDQWLRMPIPNSNRLLARSMRIQGELCRFGYGRLQNAAKVVSAGLPEKQGRIITAWCALRNCYRTEAQQAELWTDASRLQVNNAKPLGDLPVYVLSVSEQPLYGDELTVLQEELTTISTNSTRTIIQGATHESLVSQPQYAAQVAQAVRRVIEATQTGEPLAK